MMIENLTPAAYETLLRQDFSTFAARCFYDLNPQTELAMNWHVEVIAAKLTAVRQGKIRRLIINLPPRHLNRCWLLSRFRPGVSGMIPRRKSSASAMPKSSPTSSPAIAASS
jgi:hypothetical protein